MGKRKAPARRAGAESIGPYSEVAPPTPEATSKSARLKKEVTKSLSPRRSARVKRTEQEKEQAELPQVHVFDKPPPAAPAVELKTEVAEPPPAVPAVDNKTKATSVEEVLEAPALKEEALDEETSQNVCTAPGYSESIPDLSTPEKPVPKLAPAESIPDLFTPEKLAPKPGSAAEEKVHAEDMTNPAGGPANQQSVPESPTPGILKPKPEPAVVVEEEAQVPADQDAMEEDAEFWAQVLAMEEEREKKERAEKMQREQAEERARRRAQIRIRQSDLERVVWINRGPVLTLWAAVVAQRQGYDWHEAITFGRAVASLCAKAKGQKLGLLGRNEGDPGSYDGFEEFDVFGMSIPGVKTKDGVRAVQDCHPISPATVENYLLKSFSLNLDFCKLAMEILADACPVQSIGDICYRLYETFRPDIQAGAAGWGAKGVLDLQLICGLASQIPAQ